jgi:hypothetical protein
MVDTHFATSENKPKRYVMKMQACSLLSPKKVLARDLLILRCQTCCPQIRYCGQQSRASCIRTLDFGKADYVKALDVLIATFAGFDVRLAAGGSLGRGIYLAKDPHTSLKFINKVRS